MASISKKQQQQFLPEGFFPSDLEVVVGRGKKCTDHSGNQRMRGIVRGRIQEYANANDKTHKTYIISQIFQEIRKTSQVGGFVKKDKAAGRWFAVKDTCARMNLAQAFRDELHGTYKSSKFAKQRRRWGEAVSSTGTSTVTSTKSAGVSAPKLAVSAEAQSMKAMFYPQVSCAAPFTVNQGAKKLTAVTSSSTSMKSMFYPASSRMMGDNYNSSFSMNNEEPSLYLFGGNASANANTSSGGTEKHSAISDILSAALGVIEDDDDFLADLPTEGPPDSPASASMMMPSNSITDRFTFDALLSFTDNLQDNVHQPGMENPFEPTPIAMMEHPFLDCMF